jgi:hypothetical protein
MPLLSWLRRPARPDLAWLTEDLAIGSAPAQAQWEAIFRSGIGAVLEVREEGRDEEGFFLARHIPYCHEDIPEFTAPSLSDLCRMVAWVRHQIDAGRPVLVHCRKGAGRSAMVGCATLVSLGTPLDVAFQRLRYVRPGVALSSDQASALESLALVFALGRQATPGV